MRQIFHIIVTALFFIPLTMQGAETIEFRAIAPDAVVSGQQFRIEYTLNTNGKNFRTPEIQGFEVLMGPTVSTSMSSQYVNGSMSSQTSNTYTFILLAKDPGTYNISPATITASGKQVNSNALVIKVLPPDKNSGNAGQSSRGGVNNNANASNSGDDAISNKQLFVKLSLSKNNTWEQAPILATIKLYTTNPQTNLEGANFPSFDGFLVQDIDLPDEKSYQLENYNGTNYYTVVLKQSLLYPQRSGKITIGATKLDAIIRVRKAQRSRSIFDDFFDSYQEVRKSISSAPQSIEVRALPFGKPASYSGGVGSFGIKSSISATEVGANDAVTLKLVIKGTGNIKYIKNPEIKFPADFETYDPKVEVTSKVSHQNVEGTKTIEYTFIPRIAGKFTIPATEFSYFDIQSGSYKTLKTEPYDLNVAKGEGTASVATTANFANKEELRLLGQDIHYIKNNSGKLQKEPHFIYGTWGYRLWILIPLLLSIACFIIYRKQLKQNANIALSKTKKANKVATKRLKIAGKYLAAKEKSLFYEEVLKAMWGYLSDKLNIPISQLNKANVAGELSRYGANDELVTAMIDILDTCEFAQYAPAQSADDMDVLYNKTIQAIGQMENITKKITKK